ncbi:GABA permease [Geodermatophilus sp. TF02-6]|uniref:amino acid permease n=1 Tax=Geodermatophilus sp. TF02-6 TaxID=2250575 RepID=UPI000DE9CC12|nr:amino acid permease [Geodermatophilus sp. TF02-6]RBY74377.1 GABA permease [Geodermatophilus sp. TF02-6]
MAHGAPDGGHLKKGLKQRHLAMIAIGGVIGAGLFVGSGAVIGEVGPGAFITYALTGVLIVMVMRMLGEMAVANPSTGSFADYARRALGGWAGFSVGWLYWYFWVIVVGFEAVAGAGILQRWLPGVPLWVMALGLMLLMTATNLFSVTSYGEFEYWFAAIKVATIVVFIALGTLFVLGLWPGRDLDFSNLTDHGGFLPHGVGALFSGIVIVIFSMVGAEIATIAAAESAEPERAIVRATNSVVFRIIVFFVGSIFLLATILPWNSTRLGASPYVSAMEELGIPAAAEIMNAVVLTAVLSCLNSGLYTASRMLFVLAARREAPGRMLAINQRGVPMWAILSSTVVGFACVVAAYVSPDTVFLFLLNSSGAVILFVYLLICLSQLVLRRRTPPERLRVKMWFYPLLTVLTAAAIVAVLVSMAFRDDTRSQIALSLLAWALVLVAYVVRRRVVGDAHTTGDGAAAEARAAAWAHEHGAAAETQVDAAVGEGPLDPALVRRMREEGQPNEGA